MTAVSNLRNEELFLTSKDEAGKFLAIHAEVMEIRRLLREAGELWRTGPAPSRPRVIRVWLTCIKPKMEWCVGWRAEGPDWVKSSAAYDVAYRTLFREVQSSATRARRRRRCKECPPGLRR